MVRGERKREKGEKKDLQRLGTNLGDGRVRWMRKGERETERERKRERVKRQREREREREREKERDLI